MRPLLDAGLLTFTRRDLTRLDQPGRSAILPAEDCSWLTFGDEGDWPQDLPYSNDDGKLES